MTHLKVVTEETKDTTMKEGKIIISKNGRRIHYGGTDFDFTFSIDDGGDASRIAYVTEVTMSLPEPFAVLMRGNIPKHKEALVQKVVRRRWYHKLFNIEMADIIESGRKSLLNTAKKRLARVDKEITLAKSIEASYEQE